MPVAERILRAMGEKDHAAPEFNSTALLRAMPRFLENVGESILRQFLPDPKRAAHYHGRWQYPSGFYCAKSRAFQKFPDAFPPQPKGRRSLFVFHYGDYLEAVIRLLGAGAGVDFLDPQATVITILGRGHLDDVIRLQEEGAGPFEQRLLNEGYTVLPWECKSAEKFGFNRFMENPELSDTFGYRTQQSACLQAFNKDHPEAFDGLEPLTAVTYLNKVNGVLADKVFPMDRPLLAQRGEEFNAVNALTVAKEAEAFPRPFTPETVWKKVKKEVPLLDDEGNPVIFKSGARKGEPKFKTITEGHFLGNKLKVQCSYCPFKYHCWGRLRLEEQFSPWDSKKTYWLEDDKTIYNTVDGTEVEEDA